jgi:hypothetical protein
MSLNLRFLGFNNADCSETIRCGIMRPNFLLNKELRLFLKNRLNELKFGISGFSTLPIAVKLFVLPSYAQFFTKQGTKAIFEKSFK